MKQICTLIAALCLFVIAQNLNAQDVSSNTTAPSPLPTPGFKTPDSVKASNGFTSTNTGTFEDFAPFQTDTIVSPQYYYQTPQSTVSFILNCSVSNVNTAAKVLIITAAGDTISETSNSQTYQKASINYYFTFNLGTTLPANTAFKIAVIMTLDNKGVTVNTLSTNAFRGTPPVNSSLPLPVTFAGFYAKQNNNGILLTWNIGFEQNVKGYEVQKSSDGVKFSKIGFVTAGNLPTYNYNDGASSATAYYRIKSVDNDGKFMYSTVISVKGEQQSSVVMKAFPNPAQNQLTIQHNSTANQSKIEVVSVDGKLVKSLTVSANTQETSIDLSATKAGIYILRFIDESTVISLKVVKQ
jgi:hypothetical protein